MSKIKFEGWFPRRESCFVISNTGADNAVTVTKETFVNPPIKLMGVTEASDSELLMRYSQDILSTPQMFNDNLVPILRGNIPEWRLMSVDLDVDPGGITLWFGSNNPAIVAKCKEDSTPISFCAEDYALGMVVLSAPAWPEGIEIEICDPVASFSARYKLEIHMFSVHSITRPLVAAHVTKTIGKQKIYELEMREDNHGKIGPDSRQYYIGELNL